MTPNAAMIDDPEKRKRDYIENGSIDDLMAAYGADGGPVLGDDMGADPGIPIGDAAPSRPSFDATPQAAPAMSRRLATPIRALASGSDQAAPAVVRYTEKQTPIIAPAPKDDSIPGTTPGGAKPDPLDAALNDYKQRRMVDDPSWIARAFEGASAGLALRKPDQTAANNISEMYQRQVDQPINDARLSAALEDLKRKRALDAALLAQRQSATAKNLRTSQPSDPAAVTVERMREKYASEHPKAASTDAQAALAERIRHNRAMEAKPSGASVLSASAKATDDRDIAKRRDENKQELAKIQQQHEGYAGILKELEGVAPGVTGGDPSGLPSASEMTLASVPLVGQLAGEKAQRVRQLQNRLQQLVALDTSGKVLNATEIANLRSFLGADWVARPELFANAARILKDGLHRSLVDTKVAYGKTGGPEDRYAIGDEYTAKNPNTITADDPMFGGPKPTSLKQAAKAAAVGSTFDFGGKTYRKVSETHIEEG